MVSFADFHSELLCLWRFVPPYLPRLIFFLHAASPSAWRVCCPSSRDVRLPVRLVEEELGVLGQVFYL